MTEHARTEPNRLASESSPYLLQHAYNPVDWYPWGSEALEAARERDVPVFLSIGYSACHWCHVMEHESFEDEQIAGFMNKHFVNIKVDREERPDLDAIYMNAVIAMTQHGGWPMSVFLTPDLRPFYGGTYWPPRPNGQMAGFTSILELVHNAWLGRQAEVERAATELTNALQTMGQPAGEPTNLTEDLLQHAERLLLQTADPKYGGFGRAPKFPHAMDLRLLLRCWKRFGNEDALKTVCFTLDKMAQGGIYDQLGGGFHRYSTDDHWLAPHFEKMLYDNALLASLYLEAFQATGEERFARIARETLDYVLREMTQPEGGFYSTQDADSEGVEGKFFVWTADEIINLLGEDDAKIFHHCYGVTTPPNWEEGNILHRQQTNAEDAAALNLTEEELQTVLTRGREKLFKERAKRVTPGLDEKVLTNWNALMISAMAQAAVIFNDENYRRAAEAAAKFVLNEMTTSEGRLLHTFKDGQARLNAYLDDYAGMVDALVDVYQATFDTEYLKQAVRLAEQMREQFHDADRGGFYYTSEDHEELITRQKDSQDNATPSGNSLAACGLLKLSRLTGDTQWKTLAVSTLELLSGQISRHPMAAGQSLIALDFLLGPSYELVLIAGSETDSLLPTLTDLHQRFLPNKVLAVQGFDQSSDHELLMHLFQDRGSEKDQLTLYICREGNCELPLKGAANIKKELAEL